MQTKKIAGMLATLMLLMVVLAVIAIPVSASEVHAEKKVLYYDYSYPSWHPSRYHVGLLYPVSLQINNNAHIEGVDQADLNKYAPEHSNVQAWNRISYGSQKSVLLIPKRYAAFHWGFVEEIYLQI